MRIFKKVLLLFLIGIALSLYSCSLIYGTCGEATDTPVSIVDIIKVRQMARGKNNVGYKILTENQLIDRNDYVGFWIEFKTRTIAYQKNIHKPFSLFSSAYALSCEESTEYLKEVYPISIKVYNLRVRAPQTDIGSIANTYISMPFLTKNSENTEFDISDVLEQRFDNNFDDILVLKFGITDKRAIYYASHFKIEITLNTGEVLTTETDKINFKN